MKTLVLAEKPSVGKELARVLGCNQIKKTHCEGKQYIVTWAMGHLVELADPGAYDPEWKTWKISYLPMLPERMKHRVMGRTSAQFRSIKGLFQRSDITNLVIATDAGREGELVARWIMRLGGWKGPFQRLWISSQTDKAIRDGFKQLKPGRQYDHLFRAAECRAEADWIIGLNISRALSCKYDARLSAGRVQTPTLSMIIKRENEIRTFVPQPYWTIQADCGEFTALWQSAHGHTRFNHYEDALKIADKVRDKEGVIESIKVKDKSQPPPLAYDLTALQRDANKMLGFSAKKTLQTLQTLYERHKIVTYPRTDSRYITADIVPTLKDRLLAVRSSKYEKIIDQLLEKGYRTDKHFVNDRLVSDHHAIIPTELTVQVNQLSIDEKAIWDLVVRQFLTILSPDYQYKTTTLKLNVAGEIFMARGIKTVSQGWRRIGGSDGGEKNEDLDLPLQNLDQFKEGEKKKIKKVNLPKQMTRPPARYTEGTLLGAMENAGQFIDNKELKQSIQKGGIGTPATRADIIEKLFSNYYIERNGKELVPTAQGYELIAVVPSQLCSPELTARWELRLEKIARGNEKSHLFSQDIRNNARQLVQNVIQSRAAYEPQNKSTDSCPVCGQNMLKVKDKKGKTLLVCRSRACGYEQSPVQEHSLNRKPSKREQMVTKKMIHKYTDNDAKETFTLGDLLKKSMQEKKKKNR